jgi:gliding motility-associated-like protein
VTLIVTDIYDNVGTCTAIVTVHYAVIPNPVVTPAADVVCDKETTNLTLTNNIPNTTWTWTVNPSPGISGASNDDSGLHSSIIQTLSNSDYIAHNVIYTITPRLYGQCNLATISADIWVNPKPEILISSSDTMVCIGESTTITVQNPNLTVRGQWLYDLTVVPDAGITGNTISGTFTNAMNLTETLFNNDTKRHKVVYRFTPRIIPDDGGSVCNGIEKTITIWVHPKLKYTKELSDYNGFNISCFGRSNGFINIDPSSDLAPFTFKWTGPEGFAASTEDISGLIAGQYTILITDVNMCITADTFKLTEPGKLSMTIDPSISLDGGYNINCAGASTGSVTVTAINNVGPVAYLWIDGQIGKIRTDLIAGTYKIIIIDSNNCNADSTVTLTEPEKIKTVFDVTEAFCPDKPDGEIRLSVTGGISGNDYTYLWSDNSTGKNLSNIPAGLYKVTVVDMNGCSIKDSVQVSFINKICLIMPDVISPNRDLINDVWNIENIELYPQVEITIYNRWGQSVWKSERGYPLPWDGRSNGASLPIDSYHYVIDLHNGSEPIVGAITIVR